MHNIVQCFEGRNSGTPLLNSMDHLEWLSLFFIMSKYWLPWQNPQWDTTFGPLGKKFDSYPDRRANGTTLKKWLMWWHTMTLRDSSLHLQSTLYVSSYSTSCCDHPNWSYYFQGAKRKDSTKQETQLQSVAFNSWVLSTGVIIFSKYRHNNV